MHEYCPLDQYTPNIIMFIQGSVIFSAPSQVLISMPGNTKEQTEALHYIPVSALRILGNGIHEVQTTKSAAIIKKKKNSLKSST